jgi:hypothetical protein
MMTKVKALRSLQARDEPVRSAMVIATSSRSPQARGRALWWWLDRFNLAVHRLDDFLIDRVFQPRRNL